MKSIALLVGVNESNIPNVPKLRGAKFDVESLEWMFEQNLKKQFTVEKLYENNATSQNFIRSLTNIKNSVGVMEECFLFVYYTGHTQKINNENHLCFYDITINESDFITHLDFTPNFKIFVVINSCFAAELFLPQKQLSCPAFFILSSGSDILSPASPTPSSTTYFTSYFIDTWQVFNYLDFNYEQFYNLLDRKVKKSLKISRLTFNDSNSPNDLNSFFGNYIPLVSNRKPDINYIEPKNVIYIKPDLYDYMEVKIANPHSTYNILDSFTIDLEQANRTDEFVTALENVIRRDAPGILDENQTVTPKLDKVKFVGVVLVKLGEGNNKSTINLNYMYKDGGSELKSNGLVVFLNIDNDFQLVAHERTSGRVTNKIGGL